MQFQMLPPAYTDGLSRQIAALQYLQLFTVDQGDISLADLVRRIETLQVEHGPEASLEDVIQALVAEKLVQQMAARKRNAAA